MPIYNLNGKKYNIPQDVVARFENDYPEAMQAYQVGDEIYDVSVEERGSFLEDFPDAALIEQEAAGGPSGEPSGTGTVTGTAGVQASAAPAKPKPEGLAGVRGTQNFVGVRGVESVGQSLLGRGKSYAPAGTPVRKVQQPTQTASDPVQKPTQATQVASAPVRQQELQQEPQQEQQPQAPDPELTKEEEIALIGRASRGDQEAIAILNSRRGAQQQMKDQLDYMQATGRMLKNPTGVDQTQIGIAPTVARDENGNVITGENGEPVTGVTTERGRVKAQKAVEGVVAEGAAKIEEQRARKANAEKELEEVEAELREIRRVIDKEVGRGVLTEEEKALDKSGERQSMLQARIKELKSLIKNLAVEEAGGEQGFVSGLTDAAMDPSTWLLGLDQIGRTAKMLGLKNKIEAGEELTQDEREFLRAVAENQDAEARLDEGSDWLYRAGRMTMQMVPFALQIGATSKVLDAVAGVGTRIGERYAAEYAAAYGKDALAHRLAAWAIKNTGTALGDMAAGYVAANTVGAANTLNDILGRRIGNLVMDDEGNFDFVGAENWLNAFWKGESAQAIEFATERFGEHLPTFKDFTGWVASKKGLSGLSKVLSGIEGNVAIKNTWDFLNKFQIQGIPAEVIEEEMGILLNTALTGDNTWADFVDGRTQGDIVGGMFLSLGAMGAIGVGGQYGWKGAAKVYNTAQYYKYKNRTDKASSFAGSLLGDNWQDMQAVIDGTTNEEMPELINALTTGGNILGIEMTEAQRRAVQAYVYNLLTMRGFNLATTQKAREAAQKPEELWPTEEEQRTEEAGEAEIMAADAGYNAPQSDYYAMGQEWEQARAEVEKAGLAGIAAQRETMPEGEWKQVWDGLGAQQQEILSRYFNAEAALQGVEQRVQDDADNATRTYEVAAGMATHEVVDTDGQHVQEAWMGTLGGKPVFVLQWTLGGSMTVLDPETLEKKIVSDQEVKDYHAVDPNEYIAGIREGARQAAEERADLAASRHPKTEEPHAGLAYNRLNPETGAYEPWIITSGGDGTWTLQPAVMNKEGQWAAKSTEQPVTLLNDQVIDEQNAWHNSEDKPSGEPEGTVTGANPAAQQEEGRQQQPSGEPSGTVTEPGGTVTRESGGTVTREPEGTATTAGVPLTEEGEVDFGKMTPEQTLTYFTSEESPYEGGEVDDAIAANLDEAQKKLNAANSKREKFKPTGKPMKDLAVKKELFMQQKTAQDAVDYWNQVRALRQKATGRDLIDENERHSAEMQQVMQEAEGNREAMRRLNEREPETLQEIAANMLANGVRVMGADEEVGGTTQKGLLSHTGFSRADVARMPFIFASSQNGGLSAEAFGEAVLQEARDRGIRYDEDDANAGLNALIEVLGSVRTQGDINNYIQNRRIAEVKEMLRHDAELQAEYEEEERHKKESGEGQVVMTAESEMPFAPSAEEPEAAQAGVEQEAKDKEAEKEEFAKAIVSAMKEHAITAPMVEITAANWKDRLQTPIGEVKMGENQKTKLFVKGREQQYGMLLETLENPDIVLEERDKEDNMFHERPSSYLFVKTFQKGDGTKYVHFESVTVQQDGMEVSVSSHIIRENQLLNKLKSDRLLYKATALDEPANSSAGQPTNEGSGLSSGDKGSTESLTEQENGEEINNNLQEEDALAERIDVLEDEESEEESPNGTIYHRPIIVDGKYRVDQVSEPNKKGEYTGAYYAYDGKRFGDLQEVMRYIDTRQEKGTKIKKDSRKKVSPEEVPDYLHITNTSMGYSHVTPMREWSKKVSDMRGKGLSNGWHHANGLTFYIKFHEGGRGGDNVAVWFPGDPYAKVKRQIELFIERGNRLSDNETLVRILNGEKVYEEAGTTGGDSFLVSDERYDELRKRLKAKFGQLNAGLDPETAILTGQMMVYHIERGVRKLVDVAKKLVEDFGDAVRPYLRSSYEWARAQTEDAGVSTEGMTPYEEARKFDAANFDKVVPDVLDTANVKGAEKDLAKAEGNEKPQETEKRDSYRQGERVVLDEDGKVYRIEYITTEGEVIPGQPGSYTTYYHLEGKYFNKYTADQLSGIKKNSKKQEEVVKEIQNIAQPGSKKPKKVVSSPAEPDLFSQASEDQSARERTGNAQGEIEEGNAEAARLAELTEQLMDKLDGEERAQWQFVGNVQTAMLSALQTGEKPYTGIRDLRKAAQAAGMYVDENGSTDILLQELAEKALVRAARLVISSRKYDGRTGRETFEAIKKLYEMQPTLGMRSSEKVKMQQYSTPLPMSFVADMWAYREGMEKMLEPTAGNGMLVIGIPAKAVHANELDETRLKNLRSLGFASVTNQDATLPFVKPSGEPSGTVTGTSGTVKRVYDGVVANPPFGSAEEKSYDGVMISGLDPQITINSLEAMKDDGCAAIIIGGNMEYASNGAIKNKRDFFCYLYDHYNVAGVVDMAGDLYAKQGTKYPTRMILINGRRSEEERAQTTVYPPVQSKAVQKVETFDELYDTVLGLKNSNKKTNGTEILRTAGLPLADGVGQERPSNGNRPGMEHHEDDGHVRGGSERGGSTQDSGRHGDAGVQQAEGSGVQGTVRPGNAGVSGTQSNTGRPAASSSGGRGGTAELSGRDELGQHGSRGDSGERVGVKPSGEPSGESSGTVTKKRGISDEKLSYRPHNGAFSLESVAPAAMVEAMDAQLKKIEAEVGNIDEFVTNELGYGSVAEMHKALAAEQVDSVAMAIYQMKQGQAMIIGDQTGVGKGRQMAALIRWGVKQGKKPVFVTKDANLFTDIYRDLVDVGSGDLRPFIVNARAGKNAGIMLDANEQIVYSALPDKTQKRVMEGYLAGEEDMLDAFDYIVLSYFQVNTGDAQSRKEAEEAAKESGKRAKSKKKDSKRAKSKKKDSKREENPLKAAFLRKVAKDNYLFLDESHTAAGDSNQGAYFQSIMKDAKAATFASATFAKRPDTMPLYALRTAMSKAKMTTSELIEAIIKGGVTLQEIMSRALTAAGQMVRRERDMSDVQTDWKTVNDPRTVERARRNYDKTIEAFNAIIQFQEEYVKPHIDNISGELADVASSAGVKQGTDKMGVNNVPFASKTYNYTKQLMLALKADAVIDEVVKEIAAGRHPVIALESTMESAYTGFAVGSEIPEPTFAMSLLKGLDTVMQYSVKSGKETTSYPIHPEDLGEAGERAYYELRDMIRKQTGDVYISPIDYIIDGLRAKGLRVGELTGRSTYLERAEDGKVYVRNRTKAQQDKKAQMGKFNRGEVDVLILNKSASTGISLHASAKFSDQRQRTMIIAQPLSDINDYMQMIGRIDRTGQVHRGYYINLGLPVPAEQRFLMMLSTKLKSLNANTTTSQDNEDTDVEAPDLLNKYGSQVVIEYLRDNPDVYEAMGEPLKDVDTKKLEEYTAQEDDARRITGFVALLPTAKQEEFYNDVIRRYTELMRYLNETDSNDLKITVMPLRAETLETGIASPGVDPTGENPFARNANVERVMIDVLRKPMKSAEIRALIDKLNKLVGTGKGHLRTASEEKMMDPRVLEIIGTVQREADEKLAKENERYSKALDTFEESLRKQKAKILSNAKMTQDEKEAAIARFETESREALGSKHEDNERKIKDHRDMLVKRLSMFGVGQTYLVPDDLDKPTFMFASPAIFCGYKVKDSGITPSTTLAVFATMDGRKKVELKLSEITPLITIQNHTQQNYSTALGTSLSNWDEQMPKSTRREAYILTGNILQAIADAGDWGKLITYTDINDEVHDGILMPEKWQPTMLKSSGVPINARYADIRSGKTLVSLDKKVVIGPETKGNTMWFDLAVPKSKKDGEKFYNNSSITRYVSNGHFYERGGMFHAQVHFSDLKDLKDLLDELSRMGVRVKEAKEENGAGGAAPRGAWAVEEAAPRIREKAAPKKTGKGYKVFVLKDGQLYPPMVANPNGEATPVGIWLDADAAPVSGTSKTGRPQVKAGGKGTQGGSGQLAYRPGWHLGEIPYALQFNRKNEETGERELFPANFVWAEVEYADDVNYQKEAEAEGMTENGKFNHALAGLKKVPENGSYRYRTNPDPKTDPWIITGAMKVNRVLTPGEVDEMVRAAGREPQPRQAGAVTDAQVEALNEQLALNQEDAVSDMIHYINGLAQTSGMEGAAVTQCIRSREELEALKGKIPNASYEAAVRCYEDPDVTGVYLNLADMVVIFPERIQDRKAAEVTFAHEQTHHAWWNLEIPAEQRALIENAALEYLHVNNPTLYNHIINTFEERKRGREAVSYFVESTVKEYGLTNFMAANFNGNSEMATLAAQIQNYLKNGTARNTVSAVRDHTSGGNNRGRESAQGRGSSAAETRPEDGGELRGGLEEAQTRVNIGAEGLARESYERAMGRAATRLKEISQDRWQSVLEGMRAVETETGTKVQDYENPYFAAIRAGSQSAAEAELFHRQEEKALLDEISRIVKKGRKTVEEIDDYAYLKHALERNRVLAFRDALDKLRRAYKRATGKDVYDDVYKAYKNDANRKVNEKALADARSRYLRGELDEEGYWQEYEAYVRMDDMLREMYLNDAGQALPIPLKMGEAYRNNREQDYSGLTGIYESEENAPKLSEMEKEAFLAAARFEKDVDTGGLWKAINNVSSYGLRHRYESGMISKEVYDYLTDMFENYVPLRGWDSDTAEDLYTYSHGDGSPERSMTKRAKGRRSKADKPLATLLAQTEMAIVVGNQNLAKQYLLRLAENHHTNLMSVSKLWYKYNEDTKEYELVDYKTGAGIRDNDSAEEIRKKYEDFEAYLRGRSLETTDKGIPLYTWSGETGDIPVRILPQHLGEHQVVVKRGGKDFVITVNGNPRMAQAMNGKLTGANDNVFRKLSRGVSALLTSLNLNFITPNFFRDWGFAHETSDIRDNTEYSNKLTAYVPIVAAKMPGLLRRYLTGSLDMSKKTDRLFQEFMTNGGETGRHKSWSISEYQRALKDAERVSTMMKDQNFTGIVGQSWRKMKDVIGAIFSAVEFFARWSETSTRFAAFMVSKEMGRSTSRAVYDAKQITANFDKKGSGKELLDREKDGLGLLAFGYFISGCQGYVPFFNAATQGFSSMMDAAYGGYDRNEGSKKKAVITAGKLFTLGMVWPFVYAACHALLSGFGGDDDDEKKLEDLMQEGLEKYFEHPEWDRRLTLIVGDLKLPLSPEVRSIYGPGEIVTETMWKLNTGRYVDGSDVAWRYANSAAEIFPINPVEGGRGLLPVPLAAYVDIQNNKSWSGAPIHKTLLPWEKNKKAEYELVFDGQYPVLTDISKYLNDLSRGDNEKIGAININPANMGYFLRQNLGGLYAIPSQTVITISSIASGDGWPDSKDIPVFGRFVSTLNPRQHKKHIDNEYYDNVARLEEFESRLKEDRENGKTEEVKRKTASDEYQQLQALKEYKKYIRKAREDGNAEQELELKELLNAKLRGEI